MIKSLRVQNYRSFLDETIAPLSPQVTLVVGSNGQGKSNFYSALMFALTDEISTHISPEQYRALLNVILVGETARCRDQRHC